MVEGTSLILLGTQAGPPVEFDRAGIASALVVDGATYVIDCGRGALTQFVKARLRLDTIRSVFITHLHHDHVADYYNFFLLGGIGPNSRGDILRGPIPVYGPGSAGALPAPFGPMNPPTVNPENPTPGLADLTESSHAAYAYSSNLFLRDSGIDDVRALIDVHEIQIPDIAADPIDSRAPTMDPFMVVEDDHVRVSATLVPHGPCYPSFAYRFDTAHGAVCFSGDTALSENVISLARGADILVHEAINLEGSSLPPVRQDHMSTSHVEVQQVGLVASRAQARHLVLSHVQDFGTPQIDTSTWLEHVRTNYTGQVTIGEDLQRFELRPRQDRRGDR